MTDEQQPDATNAPEVTERTQGQKTTFWFFWILFLVPLLGLFVLADMAPGILLAAVPHIIIQIVAVQRFNDLQRPFSAAMSMLVGGLLLYYFVVFGGCMLLLSNMNFH